MENWDSNSYLSCEKSQFRSTDVLCAWVSQPGETETTERGCNSFQWENHCSGDFGSSVSDRGRYIAYEEKSGLPECKTVRVHTLLQVPCNKSDKSLMFQELSVRANNYHVFHTEVSGTVTSDSIKYSGLFRSQHCCYDALRLWSKQSVRVYLKKLMLVLWY